METKTFNEIKKDLIQAWEKWGENKNQDFSMTETKKQFAKKQIKKLNSKNIDLIDLRDVISIRFRFANKDKNESFKDFRESGKDINLFISI